MLFPKGLRVYSSDRKYGCLIFDVWKTSKLAAEGTSLWDRENMDAVPFFMFRAG